MSAIRRIRMICLGLLVIGLSIVMFFDKDSGIELFTAYIILTMVIYGLKQLAYFFSMGIHMIGGKLILYKGLIALDMGVLFYGMSELHPKYVMLYLLGWYVFSCGLSMLRFVEMRRLDSAGWKLQLGSALVSFLIALVCLLNLNSAAVMIDILCAGFIYSALVKIMTALHRTAIIYIP